MAVKRKVKKREIQQSKLISAIAVVLAAAVIISCIVISNSGKRHTQAVYDFGKPVAQGIDVSEHNEKIDWQGVAEEYDFAFIRVGYRGYGNGSICEDKYAKENLKAAEKAGIPFGVYFYTQAVSEKEAKVEADFVIDIVRHYDLKLPIVIDFEYPTDESGYFTGRLAENQLSKEENTKIVNAFCSRVEDKGYISGVYASSSVLQNDLKIDDFGDNTVVWAADYGSIVSYDVDYDIWQYSKTGQSECVESKYVDLNYWYK